MGRMDHAHHYWQVFGPLRQDPKRWSKKGYQKWSFWVVRTPDLIDLEVLLVEIVGVRSWI